MPPAARTGLLLQLHTEAAKASHVQSNRCPQWTSGPARLPACTRMHLQPAPLNTHSPNTKTRTRMHAHLGPDCTLPRSPSLQRKGTNNVYTPPHDLMCTCSPQQHTLHGRMRTCRAHDSTHPARKQHSATLRAAQQASLGGDLGLPMYQWDKPTNQPASQPASTSLPSL